MTPQQISQAADGIPVISMIPSTPKLLTYAANTNQLNLALQQKFINQAIKNIAIQVVDDNIPLADIPYREDGKSKQHFVNIERMRSTKKLSCAPILAYSKKGGRKQYIGKSNGKH